MKGSYNEGVASHIDPESCLDDPRGRGEALTGVNVFLTNLITIILSPPHSAIPPRVAPLKKV
ncbi:RNA-directed DNA polymerase [Candidatus Scalindua japonica]|uniref:RNA-directed DNA polymerase n=1 Tax=Candidatus Scalindua japonica TaxID=1284222 RepID=A0A286TZ34_9BACT|nr:hypothetical protein [Candidatus Scalindua japonica]GAX61163.1 RNA-directed DNA polymerase [Candidatus Scalindua japonica]